jgi:hypothetical protein
LTDNYALDVFTLRCSYQSGFLSILYSIGSKPLQIWDKEGELVQCTAVCKCGATLCNAPPATAASCFHVAVQHLPAKAAAAQDSESGMAPMNSMMKCLRSSSSTSS